MRQVGTVGRRGFSLVEIACMLAIFGLVLAAMIWFWTDSHEAALTVETREEVVTVLGAISDLYSGQADFQSLSVASLVANKVVPNKWVRGGAMFNPFKGTLDVQPTAGGSGYAVKLTGISPGACRKLLMQDMGSDVSVVPPRTAPRPRSAAC